MIDKESYRSGAAEMQTPTSTHTPVTADADEPTESRRRFLRWCAGSIPLVLLPPPLTAMRTPASARPAGNASVAVRLEAGIGRAAIFGGEPTVVWRYRGEVIHGRSTALSAPAPGGYLGPTLRLRPGERFRAHIVNRLPEATTVHWHGLHVPSDMDGQPRLPIAPGDSFTAEFVVRDRPGTYWYHPHPHGPDGGRTGFQVYHGLAGLLIVESEEEPALGLPTGEHELMLVIQDRRFDDHNQFVYLDQGMPGMRERMMGFLGDQILVNGRPEQRIEVAARPYRLRLLNGSNSRIYKLAWSDGQPMTVLGTDGGLLERPALRPYLTLAPAQRVDLWVDFGDRPGGDERRLVSRAFQAGMMGEMMGGMMSGMMGEMMAAERLPLGAEFDVLRFRVTTRKQARPTLPRRLSPPPALKLAQAVNRNRPRRFVLTMDMMHWTINGHRFEGTRVADDEIVRLGEVEVWEFENRSMMAHPMHVHGLQFLVLERRAIGERMGWSGLDAGHVDSGWHDTVLVMPGQRVRILLDFRDYSGFYLYHCHNLEHEDGGMMRYYRIQPR